MLNLRWSWRSTSLGLFLGFLLAFAATASADTKVWVNTNSGVYHCPGGQYYGNTKKGKYLGERQAVADGYRPAYGNACSPQDVQQARSTVRQQLASSPTGATTKVWVNTKSNVYHCPGTRYYGNTKSGRYVSEADAIAGGNRPAYGMKC